MKKGIIITSIVVVVLVALGLALFKVNGKSAAKIEVMKISESQKDKIFLNGKVEAKDSRSFYNDPMKGTIDSVKVKDGQTVKNGQTLYTYKNEEVINQIDELNRQIKSAKKNAPPAQNIEGVGVVNQVNSQVEQLESQVKSLEKKKYYSVKAPFAGKVTVNKNTEDKTTPLVTVYSTEYYVNATVSERDYGKIAESDIVEILVVPTNQKAEGTIKSISDNPMVDGNMMQGAVPGMAQETSNMSNYKVDIAFNGELDESIKNGFHVQAIKATVDDTIRVPEETIIKTDKESYCFKVVDKKLVKQVVTLGEIKGKSVVVSSGIKIGDSIVKNPNNKMKEGDLVE